MGYKLLWVVGSIKMELIANWIGDIYRSRGLIPKGRSVSESQGKAESSGIDAESLAFKGAAWYQKSKLYS